MAIYELPLLDALLNIVRFLAPAIVLLVIVACLSAGAAMAFKANRP